VELEGNELNIGGIFIHGGLQLFINVYLSFWGNIWSKNVTVREIDTIVLTNVTETLAREGDIVADFVGHVFRDVADMVTIGSEYLDGVWVILIGRFCLQSTFELTKIAVYVLAVGDACNIELDIV
jgi:hypothetical protein